MRLYNRNQTTDFTLNTAYIGSESLDFPNSISINGLNIELLELRPFLGESMLYTLEDYVVSISVD